MTAEEIAKLFKICLKSKRGGGLPPEDQKFCEAMYAKDPDGYRQVRNLVHETVMKDWRP